MKFLTSSTGKLCLMALLVLTSSPAPRLFAQSAAEVGGQVLDGSGAAVPGAIITLVRPSTEVKVTGQTDAAGQFILPPVAPGNYVLTVTAHNFAAWTDRGIVLEIGQHKSVTAVLALSSVEQNVTVNDIAPEINTESADRAIVTEQELVENIPLDVRNPFQEQNFTPGVTQTASFSSPAGTNLTTQSTTNTFYINGTKAGESEILIDGAVDTVFYDTHAAGAIPTLDAVREFRIYTAAYAPEFGHTGGGVASYSIKSGTNQFHGGGWEYYRNQAMDARIYGANSQPQFGRNQFGAQIGGPVILPGLYHGRNRSFFFGNYEELLDSTPYNAGAGLTTTVPTAAEKTGDFSQSTAWTLYDPATTTLVQAGSSYNCPDGKSYTAATTSYYRCLMYGVPAGGGPAKYNVIPQGEINPVAQALLGMYPLPTSGRTPTLAGSDENNYFSAAPNEDHDYYYDLRLDHRFNDRHSIFGHIDYFNHYVFYGPVFGSPSLTPTNSNDLVPGRNYMVDHTWVISPRIIFDHHFSWAHMESHRGSVSPLGTAMFGIPGSAAPGITSTFTPQIETTANQLGLIGNSEPYERNPNSVAQYTAVLSLLEGRHTFKFGGDLRRYIDQLWDPQLLTVNTSRSFTGGPNAEAVGGTSGNAVADLLVGQATVTSGFAPKVNFRHQYYAAFGEDIARVTKNLTLTYGVRYNYEGADVANGNLLTYLDTTDPSPLASQALANPYFSPAGLVGGVGVVGLNGADRSLQVPGKLHFEPRLGVAYSLNDKTVIHAGGGIFWHPTPTWQTNPASYGSTRKSTSIDAAANGYTPLNNLSNPFPNGLPAPYGNNPAVLAGNNTASGPLSIELGQSISGNPRRQQVSYEESWSADVQRELPAHFVLTAVYAGSIGVHLYGALQLDQLSDAALATGGALTAVVNNPFYGTITDSSSVLSTPTVEAGLLERPFPQFTGFEELNVGYGHSSYQAGQFTVEHRLSQGLSMLVAYTWSHTIDDVAESGTTAGVQDNGCMRCERSDADLDLPDAVRVSSIYQLPFGPGKPMATHGLLGYLTGGWEIGGTYQYTSGQPLSLTSPTGLNTLSTDGQNVLRPSLVPGQSITDIKGLPRNAQGVAPSFNYNAFMQPGQSCHGAAGACGAPNFFQFGNAPRYLSDVRYPAVVDLDAVVKKTTSISERLSATFRAEALNALNNVVFGAPDTGVTDSNFGYNARVQQNNPRYIQLSGRLTF